MVGFNCSVASGQCLNSEIMSFFQLAASIDVIITEKKIIEQKYPRCMDRWKYLLVSIRQACVSREAWLELEQSELLLAIQIENLCEENKLLISA